MEDLEEWLMQLDRANKSKRLPPIYFGIISDFFTEYWYQDIKSIDETEFFYELNPIIRKDVNKYIILEYVAAVIFIYGC